jgi:hypothetical protein
MGTGSKFRGTFFIILVLLGTAPELITRPPDLYFGVSDNNDKGG